MRTYSVFRRCCFIGLFLFAASGAAQGVELRTQFSVAPIPPSFVNGGLNPTFITWNDNAIDSMLQGGGDVGDYLTDPAAFHPTDTFTRLDNSGTGQLADPPFPSWRGVANPPAPFDQEYGNALFFGLHVLGEGEQFKLGNLDNVMSSNDAGDYYSYGSGLAANRNYSFFRVGIDYGADHAKGTADDVTYSNGESGALPVDELLYSGVGVWEEIFDIPGATDQEKLDASIGQFFLDHPLTQLTNTFVLKDDAGAVIGQVSKTATLVPEPATALLVGMTALFLPLVIRRRGG